MASSVDLPQPDGPAIERYSPFLTSKWTLDSACVSTSSVTKTLLTFSSRMSDCDPLSIFIAPCYEIWRKLVQLDSIVSVVGRHIGEDDPVSDLQPVLNFNRIDRAAAERNLHLLGVLAVRIDLEQLHRRV